ncbi:MAG: hypothetical protein HY335_10495 [Deinococcus sp.]|nr:hypothetical protein [Deinococcus sp.]
MRRTVALAVLVFAIASGATAQTVTLLASLPFTFEYVAIEASDPIGNPVTLLARSARAEGFDLVFIEPLTWQLIDPLFFNIVLAPLILDFSFLPVMVCGLNSTSGDIEFGDVTVHQGEVNLDGLDDGLWVQLISFDVIELLTQEDSISLPETQEELVAHSVEADCGFFGILLIPLVSIDVSQDIALIIGGQEVVLNLPTLFFGTRDLNFPPTSPGPESPGPEGDNSTDL